MYGIVIFLFDTLGHSQHDNSPSLICLKLIETFTMHVLWSKSFLDGGNIYSVIVMINTYVFYDK